MLTSIISDEMCDRLYILIKKAGFYFFNKHSLHKIIYFSNSWTNSEKQCNGTVLAKTLSLCIKLRPKIQGNKMGQTGKSRS